MVVTRGLTGPVPDGSSTLYRRCVLLVSTDLLRTRCSPQGARAKACPALSAASPPLSDKALSCGLSAVSRRRNDVGPRRSGFLTVFSRRPHHAPGMSSVDTRPPHRERLVSQPQRFRRVRILTHIQGRIVMPPEVSSPGHSIAALAGRPWLRTPPEGEFER